MTNPPWPSGVITPSYAMQLNHAAVLLRETGPSCGNLTCRRALPSVHFVYVANFCPPTWPLKTQAVASFGMSQ